MNSNAERFTFQQNEPLRVTVNNDGKLLICLLDVCRILGVSGISPSAVLDRINPYQRIQCRLDNGVKALFITYPDLANIPHRLQGVDAYKVDRLCEFIRKEIIPVSQVDDRIAPNQSYMQEPIRVSNRLPKTYSEALRELANTTERLEAMKLELAQLKLASGYVSELTNLVEKTLMLNGIRI